MELFKLSMKTLPITRFDKDEVNRKVMDDCLSTISNMRLTMKEELEEEELTMKFLNITIWKKCWLKVHGQIWTRKRNGKGSNDEYKIL